MLDKKVWIYLKTVSFNQRTDYQKKDNKLNTISQTFVTYGFIIQIILCFLRKKIKT